MTIKELEVKKRELECKIQDLIDEFNNLSNATVMDVNLTYDTAYCNVDGLHIGNVNIDLDVKL